MPKKQSNTDPQMLEKWEAFETYAIPVTTEEINKNLPPQYFIHIKFMDPPTHHTRRIRLRLLEKTTQALEYWPCMGSSVNIIRASNLQDCATNANALTAKSKDLIKRVLKFAEAIQPKK